MIFQWKRLSWNKFACCTWSFLWFSFCYCIYQIWFVMLFFFVCFCLSIEAIGYPLKQISQNHKIDRSIEVLFLISEIFLVAWSNEQLHFHWSEAIYFLYSFFLFPFYIAWYHFIPIMIRYLPAVTDRTRGKGVWRSMEKMENDRNSVQFESEQSTNSLDTHSLIWHWPANNGQIIV